MVVELVYLQFFWLNFLIPLDYISTTMGPGTIICGRTYDYNNLCGPGSQYVEYVQTHEKTSHTMKVRTVGALTLQPSGNRQDAFYYLSLESRRHLYRRRCTPLPMPSNIIDRVHALASK